MLLTQTKSEILPQLGWDASQSLSERGVPGLTVAPRRVAPLPLGRGQGEG